MYKKFTAVLLIVCMIFTAKSSILSVNAETVDTVAAVSSEVGADAERVGVSELQENAKESHAGEAAEENANKDIANGVAENTDEIDGAVTDSVDRADTADSDRTEITDSLTDAGKNEEGTSAENTSGNEKENFADMDVEAQYKYLQALETEEEKQEALVTLTQEKREALDAYIVKMEEASEEPSEKVEAGEKSFSEMTVEEQYKYLQKLETEEAKEEVLAALTQEQLDALNAYIAEMDGKEDKELTEKQAAFLEMTMEEQYEYLLTLEDEEEIKVLLNLLTEEQLQALMNYAEQMEDDGDLGDFVGEIIYPIINFTNVALFRDPITGQSTVKRLMRSAASRAIPEDDNGLILNKTATDNGNGTYQIQLEAYTTGNVTSSRKEVPTDIVLVLDQSGSMGDHFGEYKELKNKTNGNLYDTYGGNRDTLYIKLSNGGYSRVGISKNWTMNGYVYTYTFLNENGVQDSIRSTGQNTEPNIGSERFFCYFDKDAGEIKLDALKSAVTQFTNEVAQKAAGEDGELGTLDDIDHRIAVVGFASERYYGQGWNAIDYKYGNTEVFVGSDQYTYNAGGNNPSNSNSAQSNYNRAFQNMNEQSGRNNITDSINALTADGGTFTSLGVEMANGILESNPIENGEQRNRVIIVFTDGQPGWSGYDSDVASAAITQGERAKNSGATVYTVGIFSGANANSAGSNANNASDTEKSNWFMQNLSSNNGIVQNPSYYLSAGDADSLNNIFQQISDQIQTPNISLGTDTVVKDIISPYFQLNGVASDITLQTADFNGTEFETAQVAPSGVRATVDEDTINVTGFDFNTNFVTENAKADGTHGKKLIITFNVMPKEGFLGGNGVPTNGEASGVYNNSEAIEMFVVPRVDVPIPDITIDASDKNIYLLDSLTPNQLSDGIVMKAGNTVLNDAEQPLEEWQKAFVNITQGVTPAEGFTTLTTDHSYTAYGKVSPTTSGAAVEKSGSAEGNINVFKPEVTFKDSTVWYGDDAPLNYEANKVDEKWVHVSSNGSTENKVYSENVNMSTAKPTLDLTYTREENAIVDGKINVKDDISIDVEAKIGAIEVDQYVEYIHQSCGKECDFDGENEKFRWHVKTCDLTITKNNLETGEVFIFNIQKDGESYGSVTVASGASVTIKELPIGSYTVEEDAGWAWRYAPVPVSKTVVLSSFNSSSEVSFVNNKKNDHWLSFSTIVKNIFGNLEGVKVK